jgi:hypothetical protein
MTNLFEERIEAVASDLEWLAVEVMFFGAGVIPLYVEDSELASDLRPTEDLDALVGLSAAVSGQVDNEVRKIEQALREHGWTPDLRPHRRNVYAYLSPSGIAVDFVFDVLQPPTDWPVVAQASAMDFRLGSGRTVRIPTPALFLVCKAEASRSKKRWSGAYDSHDLEDIAMLIAGCETLASSAEQVPPDATDYLAEWARELLTGSTEYGQQAYACLEGNWPRNVHISLLDRVLRKMVQ